uniref:Uncharacterized protein n=1 Tax=Meloidogyne enterolobii TaxID=390850 RepID=A0A6V7VJ76_MELEN|nr:unnamed protein product [Meloidogyne enterolobii]
MGAELSTEHQQQLFQKQFKKQIFDKTLITTKHGKGETRRKTSPLFVLEKKKNNKNCNNQKLDFIFFATKSMHSPFRGLRRAAASPGSPISCCSQTCNASGSAQISIPPFPRTHCTVMVIAGTRPPTVPPSSAGSCISPSSIWTPSSTAGGISTPNRQQQINFPFDEQQNNENEHLILHFHIYRHHLMFWLVKIMKLNNRS